MRLLIGDSPLLGDIAGSSIMSNCSRFHTRSKCSVHTRKLRVGEFHLPTQTKKCCCSYDPNLYQHHRLRQTRLQAIRSQNKTHKPCQAPVRLTSCPTNSSLVLELVPTWHQHESEVEPQLRLPHDCKTVIKYVRNQLSRGKGVTYSEYGGDLTLYEEPERWLP